MNVIVLFLRRKLIGNVVVYRPPNHVRPVSPDDDTGCSEPSASSSAATPPVQTWLLPRLGHPLTKLLDWESIQNKRTRAYAHI